MISEVLVVVGSVQGGDVGGGELHDVNWEWGKGRGLGERIMIERAGSLQKKLANHHESITLLYP